MTLSILRKLFAFMLVFIVSTMMVACSTTDEEEAPADTGPTDAQKEILDDAL